MRLASLCFAGLLAACGSSGPQSDWEKTNETRLPVAEQRETVPTPPPKRGELIEFFVAATSEFRFFVDARIAQRR